MSNQKTFVVQYPPQYGVITSVIDDNNHFENTLFPSVYDGCWQSVEDIIRHNGGNAQNEYSSNLRKENSITPKIVSEPFVNPIIAITGSRGSGKSSAMYSFAEYLKTLKNHPCAFSILPPIDATQFGKNESVIGNITASMYREYSSNNADLSVDKKRDFVRLVKEVNTTAVMYSTGEWFKCGDDLLQDSEKVGNLRKRLHDLIINYLNLRSSNSLDTNKYLVIMLDDLDMCSEGAYSIIEEIRKFLCMRNVIILMTMQSSQLRTVLQASYMTAFGKVDKETEPKIRNISMELAFRSYEKLFPAARCHAMPVWSTDQLKNYNLCIKSKDEKDMYGENKKQPDDDLFRYVLDGQYKSDNEKKRQEYYQKFTILYRTLHMIWRKTLLIPVCSKDEEHLLIPSNLRSLHNFIAMLSSMEDAIDTTFVQRLPENKERSKYPFAVMPGLKDFDNFIKANPVNIQVLDKNLTVFENYLLDNLSTYGESLNYNRDNQVLAETLQNLILEMHTIPLERLNAKIVGDILDSELPDYIQTAFKNIRYKAISKTVADGDERSILQDAVLYADSISIGDVLYVLGKISVKTRCRYIAYLVEIIRTMWSIRMTREFYMHNTILDESIKVSDSFSQTVGGLLVDANTATFTKKDISSTNDWFLFQQGVQSYGELFYATSTTSIQIVDTAPSDDVLAENCLHYRKRKLDGNPYYLRDEFGIPVCHHLAYYTNALRYKTNPVIYFPFYSLDFMYRFYEEFRRQCRKKDFDVCKTLEEVFLTLDISKTEAMNIVLKTVSKYIPLPLYYENLQCCAIDTLYTSLNTTFESLHNSLDENKRKEALGLAKILQNWSTEQRDPTRIAYKKWENHITNWNDSFSNAYRPQSSELDNTASHLHSNPSHIPADQVDTDRFGSTNED